MTVANAYTLADLVSRFGGDAIGEVATPLTRVGTIERAAGDAITFLANPKYRAMLSQTSAGAVILSAQDSGATTLPRIVADNPYAYFARVAQAFAPRQQYPSGVHPSAWVHPSASVSSSASVAEFASIGEGAVIGAHVRVGPHCVIGANATVGEGSELVARVTIYHSCRLGARALLHAGSVIGADGFGFARERGEWVKIPQTGAVVIGDDCEVGANSTIDRGAIEDTTIGNGVKIDNQVQIGHNCVIGDHTIISGCTGIAGTTTIGNRVTIGGAVSITGHLSICDDAVLSANAFVTKSIVEPGMYSSGFPLMAHRDWLKNAVQLRRLDELAHQVKSLSKGTEN